MPRHKTIFNASKKSTNPSWAGQKLELLIENLMPPLSLASRIIEAPDLRNETSILLFQVMEFSVWPAGRPLTERLPPRVTKFSARFITE